MTAGLDTTQIADRLACRAEQLDAAEGGTAKRPVMFVISIEEAFEIGRVLLR
jgi:hypothetical protein